VAVGVLAKSRRRPGASANDIRIVMSAAFPRLPRPDSPELYRGAQAYYKRRSTLGAGRYSALDLVGGAPDDSLQPEPVPFATRSNCSIARGLLPLSQLMWERRHFTRRPCRFDQAVRDSERGSPWVGNFTGARNPHREATLRRTSLQCGGPPIAPGDAALWERFPWQGGCAPPSAVLTNRSDAYGRSSH